MQVVKKLLLWLLAFFLFLLLLMPKTALYYKLESFLSHYDIKIEEGKTVETPISFLVDGAAVYAKGIKFARIAKIKVVPLLVYDSVTVDEVVFDDLAADKIGKKIDTIRARYDLSDPLHIKIEASGDFGKAKGLYDLRKRLLHLRFIDAKKIDALRPWLKQDKEGWYYEKQF